MKKYKNYGFTLIELLIVMAILGVLAVVVLVAINPVQQLARTRDAGRKSAVTQVGRAMQAYYTTHGGTYLTDSNCNSDGDANLMTYEWISCLVDSGELSTVPSAINYSVGSSLTGCAETTDVVGTSYDKENMLCYTVASDGEDAVVYALMESDSELSKCTDPSLPNAFFAWSTVDGRGGLVCTNGTVLGSGGQVFVD